MAARRLLITLVLAAVSGSLLGAPPRALAEPYGQFYRPGDDWHVVETQHFRIYYTQDTQRSAARLRTLADATFQRLNAFYDYRPTRKIRVVLVGYTNFSNGFADSDHERITLFTTPPDFYTRNRLPWLEGGFTHELAHVLSLGTATHFWKRVPLVLGTGLGRSTQAQTLVKLPIYARNFPHWFAEGVAQFDTMLLGRDGFDENRKAYQRAAWEDQLFYALDKLPFFGGEQWYNTGLAFLIYLEQRFGNGTVHKLFKASGEQYDYVFDSLIDRTLGRPLSELERDFRASVGVSFDAHLREVHNGVYDGLPVRVEGVEPAYRALTPEQRERLRDGYAGAAVRFYAGKLYFRQSGVISYGDFSAADQRISNVQSLTAGGNMTRHTPNSFFVLKSENLEAKLVPEWYRPEFESQSLFLVDTDGHERRLLSEARLSDIDACPARNELAAIYNDGDGSLKLAIYPLTGTGTPEVAVQTNAVWFPLPALPFDEVRNPRYGAGCKKIYFSRRVGSDHDVLAYDFASGALETVSAEPAFELYPEPAPDGVYYASGRDGTLSLYFKPYAGGPARQVTQAVTAHHRPLYTPEAVLFSRLYGTGFQIHSLPHAVLPPAAAEPVEQTKPELAAAARDVSLEGSDSYQAFSPKNLLAPTLVPLFDLEFSSLRAYESSLRAQVGLEFYVSDELFRHALLLRAYAGDQNSFLFDYDNTMTPLGIRVRASWNDVRGLYVYSFGGSRYEQITSDRWGLLSGSVRLPINLFYTLSAVAETLRDVGVTTGARGRKYDLAHPAYGRELFGGVLSYDGLDRRDPTFRERDINKRGYRQFTLAAYYGLERVDPQLAQQDPSLHGGVTPYLRAELNWNEYIPLPNLLDGFFDHSLEIDINLGYLSQELTFFPFYGGGRLYSQASPEYNASVGFAGYSFGNLRGETLINVGLAYRGPIARNLGWNWGPFYLQDLYFQLFTSWGNIWSYDRSGRRQRPFLDAAPNGRQLLGDLGLDLRIGHFLQSVETNVGTTLRVVYRLVPFSRCPDDGSLDPVCLDPDGSNGFMFYFMFGGGF